MTVHWSLCVPLFNVNKEIRTFSSPFRAYTLNHCANSESVLHIHSQGESLATITTH